MNDWFPAAQDPWQLAGWTMLHFLWIGAVVAAIGAAGRAACRRAAPTVRYATSLATLLLLAATPAGVAMWVAANSWERIAEIGESASPDGSPLAVSERRPYVGESLRDSQRTAVDVAPPAVVELAPDIPLANPSPSHSLLGRGATAPLARLIEWLPAIWLIGAPFTFAMLAAGLVGSRRLRQTSLPLAEGPIVEACRRLERALGTTRRAALAVCEGLAQPVLVGIVKPTILLPAAALTGWSPEELEMVLVHELAHVRRWDNLVNLGQRVIESLLFFHPAVWLVSRQVRRDREECCDAAVLAHTRRPEAYASLLVSVAESVRKARRLTTLAESCTLASHALAGRVRRILKLEDDPMWISRRMLGLLVVLAMGLSCAVYRAAFAVPAPVAQDVEQDEANAKPEAAGIADDEKDDEKKDVAYVVVYPLSDVDHFNGPEWVRLFGSGMKDGVEFQWHEESKGMIVWAPREFHEQLSAFLKKARGEGLTFADLKAELAKLEAQHIDVEKELADIEVLKEVALMAAQSPTAMNAAVEVAIDKDPTIKMYQEQLLTLSQQIQTLAAGARNQNSPQLRRLQGQYQRIEATMGQYRQTTEKELKERLRNMPNEALRAAIAEYKVRKDAALKAKDEVERKIAEIEAKLLDLARDNDADHAPQADDAAIGDGEALPDAPARAESTVIHSEDTTNAPRPATLAPGDSVLLRVAGAAPDYPLDDVFIVEPEGTLALGPIYGRVAIAGKTIAEAEAAVGEHLRTILKDPRVQLTLHPLIPPSATDEMNVGDAERDYRYDGKTFDQWRNAWRFELMTEKRIEAIEALAAFGRSAYPKEAADAIFDVAGEYDFSYLGNDGDGDGKLKDAVLHTFSAERAAISPEVWLPLLVARMKAAEGAEQQRWSSLLIKLLDRWRYKMAKPPELLLELAASEELDVREAAVCALVRATEDFAQLDPQALQLVRTSLSGERPSLRVLRELKFRNVQQFPEQLDVLLEADPRFQTEARSLLNAICGSTTQPPEPYEPVLAVALGTDRTEHRVAALRALAAMSPYLNHSQPKELRQELWKLLTETEEKELLAPTMLVLRRMYGFRDRTLVQLSQLGAPNLKDVSPERLAELERLANDVREEEQIVFPNGE